ncbi:hypothetical protein OIE66_36860 [Nonomuraea sp. NBC_01738]|uniref:hypothetical protein n=1 Tax=Nonomuraea sp. NBC_01738 TaxID=2976003 RepID=UPI002E0F68F1|nr:hypothetical protein OIE66_36860 [Nonomuraea sp. NBC_01738]
MGAHGASHTGAFGGDAAFAPPGPDAAFAGAGAEVGAAAPASTAGHQDGGRLARPRQLPLPDQSPFWREPEAEERPEPEPEDSEDAPKPPRKGLRIAVAVALVAVAVGAITFDRYGVYLKRTESNPGTVVHTAQAGQEVKLKHMTWKASFGTVPSLPDGKPAEAGSVYVKIDLARTANDEVGTKMTAPPAELKFEDKDGRSWATQIAGATQTEDLKVGVESKLTGYARLPAAQAEAVELLVRPSNYRSDIPTAQIMTYKGEPELDLLRIKR